MRIDKLENIAKVLNVSIDWLLGRAEDYTLYENAEKIPLPNEIEILCTSVKERTKGITVKIPSYISADFAVRFNGDSMINARIFDGDLVFISTQAKIDNGDICAILINSEIFLKRVYKYENRIELRPENPLCEVLNFEGEEIGNIKILGKAVSFLSGIR